LNQLLFAAEEAIQGLEKPLPPARIQPEVPLDVEEVAAAIAFMASDDAGYITGEVISVGGGETFPF